MNEVSKQAKELVESVAHMERELDDIRTERDLARLRVSALEAENERLNEALIARRQAPTYREVRVN